MISRYKSLSTKSLLAQHQPLASACTRRVLVTIPPSPLTCSVELMMVVLQIPVLTAVLSEDVAYASCSDPGTTTQRRRHSQSKRICNVFHGEADGL